MRLHLNKKLRAALIAAITTVGTTLPLAQAAWEGGANEGSEYYTNTGRTNLHLTNTSDGTITFTAEQDHVTAGIAEVAVKDSATVRVRGGNHWGSGRAFDMLTIDSIKAGDGSGTVFVNAEKYDNGQAASNSTATVLGINGTLGGVQNYGVLTLGTSGSSINASGLLNNHDGATLTINGSYTFDTKDTSKYTLKSEGSVEWSDATYSQGFKKSSGSTYYAIKGATDGANIGSITDSTGTALTRESSGNYYFTVGAGDFDYTKFYVKADTATLDHDGTGQIIVERNGATLTVEHATYRDTSGSKNLNIVVEDKGVLEITHSGSNGYVTGDITINGGGTFRVAGQHDAFGWGGGTTKNIILQGENGNVATLDFQQTTGNSATFNAALKMMGYAAITGAKGFNTHDGSFYAEGLHNTIESFQIRHAATFEVKEGGELTVGTMTRGADGNKTLTKEGLGTITFTTKAQANGLVVNAGKVVISGGTENSLDSLVIGEEGTLEITGGTTSVSGTSNVISNTIELTGGELKLGGTYDISDLELQGGSTTYVGGEGIATGNGFAQTNGSLNVVHVDGGTLTLLEGVVFNYNAAPVTVGTDGVVTLPGTVSYSALHVNNGDGVSFNSAWNIAQEHTTDITGVVMANGTNIDLDKDGATFGLTLKGGATLKAAAGATTTIGSIAGWQDSTLTVTGEGTVALPGGERILTGSTKLDVQGNASTGKLVLNSNDAALTVAEGAKLAMSGNLTPTHGSVNINGTVTVNGDLDLSNGGKSDVTLQVGSTGKVTANGMWMRNQASIALAAGGEYDIKGLAIVGTGAGGTITFTPTSGDASYGTGNANFQIANATVTATANVTLGNTLVNSGVVSSAHQVTLSNAASSYAGVTVSGTGSLVVAADSNIAGTSSLATGVTINGANTLTNSGTMDINGTIVFGQNAIQNTGAITFGDDIHFNLLGMTAVDNKYTLFSGNAVDLSMYDTSRITVAGGTGAYKWTFGQDGTISYASISYTWNGGAEGVWDYETPSWNDPAVPFQQGLDAQFDSSATVAVKGEIVAGQVTVSTGNEVTLTEGEDGYLTAAGLMVEGTLNTAVGVASDSFTVDYTIAQGGTWNIQGDQLLGDGINEGTIHVDTTGDVIVFSDTPETVLAGVENDGHIGATLSPSGSVLKMGESSGTLEVYGGAVSYLSELGDQTVMLDDGTKILFGDNAGTTDAAVFANDIVLNGDASVQVWDSSKHSSATISGDVSGEDHTLTKTDGDQSLVFSGVVTLGGLTTASDGHDTIVFNGGEGSVGYIKALNAVTIQFSAKDGADNIYSFESFNMSSDDNRTNATRWLIVDSGVTLNGTGTSRKYGSTIENSWGINGGGLEINGTLNTAGIIAMDAGNTTAYIKGSGLINTKGLDLCNYTKTYIQGGIIINITSDTGIYKRNNDGEVHLLNATLQATVVDWAIKNGGDKYIVTLDDAETGTTFHVAADRTITIANILGGEGKLVKTGEGTLVLSNNNTHTGVIDVQAGKLVVEGTIAATEVTLGTDASIENKGSSPITLSDVDVQLKQIENVSSGEMTLKNVTGTLELENLTIAADSSVSFYKSAAEGVEGTITVTDTLNAGGGTLKANLTIIGSGDVEAPTQLNLGGTALTLGSTLTVDTTSGLILLDADTIAALEGLALGHDLDLFKALEGTDLGYGSEYNGTWFDAMFVRTDDVHGDYRVYATEDSFGLTKVSRVPEPTTGTLSLLALAALAARRRKH